MASRVVDSTMAAVKFKKKRKAREEGEAGVGEGEAEEEEGEDVTLEEEVPGTKTNSFIALF